MRNSRQVLCSFHSASLLLVVLVLALVTVLYPRNHSANEPVKVGLILDFVPGGIHAGIYAALGEGYFREAGIDIDIQPPTSSADTLRLLLAGQATFGIAPIADVASLRAQGENIQIFMALEQVPLAALMSTEAIGISDPGQLAGATIGVTGVPSDEAIVRVILARSGVDVNGVDFVTIGFDAVGNLIGQSVKAALGFWSAEAVALRLAGETPVIFRPDQYGSPPYPELVVFAHGDTIASNAALVQAFVDAMTRGYTFALANQQAAMAHLAAHSDGIDKAFVNAEFDNVKPYFLGPNGKFGEISQAAIEPYLKWALETGIIPSMPDNLIASQFIR